MSPEAVMIEGNGFPYRADDQILREPQEVINQRKEAYRSVGYERRIRHEAGLDDIDLDLTSNFIARTSLTDHAAETALERYGLIYPRAGGAAITNAALLLFGRAPISRWHPRASIRFFGVSGTTRQHGSRRNVTQLHRIEQPIASAIPAAYEFMRSHVKRSEKLHDLFFKEMPEYPDYAWQEAIVNAVAHRDYEMQGSEVEVWFYEDRMEIRSPGSLVPPVTLEAIQRRRPVHASRNPLLVRVLADGGIMRDEGEGIPRIFEEMEESFLRAPMITLNDGIFLVTLSNEPVFSGPSDEWKLLIGNLRLNARQKRVLLANPHRFTNEDYRRLNDVDRDQAYREIHEMVEQGIVASPSSGRGATYHISPDLRESRAFLERRLPELREFFQRSDRLTNTDYRQLFQVSRYAAAKELRRLVDEGYLRLEGERRGAHYRPTPALSPWEK